jgi:hypothetical protein
VSEPEYERFEAETGIRLGPNIGIDTAIYDDGWHDVSPRTEIVVCDFRQLPTRPSPRSRSLTMTTSARHPSPLALFDVC